MTGAGRGEAEDGSGAEETASGTGAKPAGVADDDIDASLHLALNDLERMLDTRKSDVEGSAAATADDDAEPDEGDEQYTIPLLDEVVIPGPSPVVPPPAAAREAKIPLDDDEPAVRARIAARIASEMDVIVQDRIEQALDEVRDEIRKRVRDHMDIILPEIVDELVQARKRQGRS